MSSKDTKGSSDSLQTKTKKKEKTKKETKKEKKEKSKKRDSKDLDNDSVNDNSIKTEEGDKEDSSPKSKKFGIFRLSGRKSKSDKRNSKHGSSDSLKRQSGDSADFESRGSEFSLEGSTASGEVSTTITKMSTTSAEVSTVTEVPTTSAEVNKGSEIVIKPREEEALMVETSSKVKIVSAAHSDLTEDEDTKKAGTEQTRKDDSSTKQDGLNEKLAKESLKMESVRVQEQTPVASEVEFKLQSSVTSKEVTKNVEVNEEQHNTDRAEENKKESAQLVIEEKVSTHEKDHVIEPESGHKYEVSLEDVKIEQDREITSSEDDSVDTVISTEAHNNKGLSEVNAETEIGTQSKMDVEEPIISTYRERKDALQSTSQELPPIDEEAIVLSYENKTQEEIREEQHVQEEPITLASKERREDSLMSEITFQEEPVTESEPALFIKSEKVMKEEKIHGEEQAEDPSKEELLIPTFVQKRGDNTEEEQKEKQEAPVNEEAMALSYPDRLEDQLQNESHDGPTADGEEPVVLAIDKKKGNQIEEQIEEFLKLEAKIEERPTQESETVKKDKEAEKISARDTHKENESQNDRRESAPFDKEGTFITSTPKRAWINTEQGTRADAEYEEHKATPAVRYNIIRFKGGSVVEFHLKVQIVNNIKDVKMSTKVLLAQLAEINKKLRMLQKELLEVQKSDGNNNSQANVTEVSAET